MKSFILAFLLISFFASCGTTNCFSRQPIALSKKHSYNEKYNRKDWKHWIDDDLNCFNTRHEILRDRSEIIVQISKKGKNCFVKAGQWSDYYYPEKLLTTKEIEIDHLIPLKHAHDLGAWRWSNELKKKFANDPENLVITNKKYNRKKGAKTLSEWTPVNIEYACKYYKDWMKIKNKYGLPISEDEKNAFDLNRCPKI